MVELENSKKVTESIESIDKMTKTLIEISFKFKNMLIDNPEDRLSPILLRDILIIREAQDKTFNQIHENLSKSMNASDLYEIIK